MKPNINDAAELRDLKRELKSKGVSSTAISTVEKAIRRGMSFTGVDDLAILDIPNEDAKSVGEVVTFGAAVSAGSGAKRVQYRFVPVGAADKFYGYQFIVGFTTVDDFVVEESYPIETDRTVFVDYDLDRIKRGSAVVLSVHSASGTRVDIKIHNAAGGSDPDLTVPMTSVANATIDVVVEDVKFDPATPVRPNYAVKGKVISAKRSEKLDGLQVVLYAATTVTDHNPDYVPVGSATTETNGYFVTAPLLFEDPDDIVRVKAARATVSRDGQAVEAPIRLLTAPETMNTPPTSRIPEHVILVIDDPAPGAAAIDANGCGCGDLNFHDKKVLEEYSYHTVVRTSEPSIIADVIEDEREVDLQEIYGIPGKVPVWLFKKYVAMERRSPVPMKAPSIVNESAVGTEMVNTIAIARTIPTGRDVPDRASPVNKGLLDRLVLDWKADQAIKGEGKPIFKGRTHLNQTNQIDWDDEPTIYQAASIAHGHLLHFKQEWIPDGYSMGDLVYSLPLAPGQKKQIAVLDWERRESAANSQTLEYEETLNNSLVRDRDVSDIVSGTLTENIRGNSRASTGGIGFGLGSSVMGIIPGVGTFGSLMGISGGGGLAKSSASQTSTREMTASSLQNITDRTQQATSVVRSQRATVVQTVSQGERVQATAESVANYNHCHALTIQYFEVLRHFAVRTRLADVQECLFIPLQMTPFDLEKALRWRSTLETHLLRRDLRRAFDAAARIQNERESPYENYYDSIGYPRKNFAEQSIESYSGEMLIEFFFFNTNAVKIDDDIVKFFSWFGISLDEYRDRQITDAELAQAVGPRTIERLLDGLTIRTDKGTDLRLDLTLLSGFRQGVPLRVSIRQSAGTPRSVARESIEAIIIGLDMTRLPQELQSNTQLRDKYMKIRIRSGALRYRTQGISGSLFDARIENDVFAGSDGAYIPTPLGPAELRNPRGEDVELANNLIHHLNENLEFYNKAIFFDFTPERRFMLLDGIIAPGKANGQSVASVVENRVIGMAGNSLIMPVAPGNQLDPMIDAKPGEPFDLFAHYYHDELDPMRVSVPTRGVYAEAVMGSCNSCEEKDETRFWRWEESPIPDSPNTQILPLNTDTRRADPGNLQAKDFPAPIVNIQNAPGLPEPSGLSDLLNALGKGDSFRDATGLNQNQLSALAAYQKAMDNAKDFGVEAAKLAESMAKIQAAKDLQRQGQIKNEDAQKVYKEELQPDAKKQQQDTNTRLETIEDAKKKGQVNDDQGEVMSEDVIRKDQGTTKPKTAKTSPSSGLKTYQLQLFLQEPNESPLVGTWVLNFGDLVEHTFETDGTRSSWSFPVKLKASAEPSLELRGNPGLIGVSLMPGKENYYHHASFSPVLGANRNIVIYMRQKRDPVTVTVAQTASWEEAVQKAFEKKFGSSITGSGGSGPLTGLFAEVTIGGEVHGEGTWSDSTTNTSGGSASGTIERKIYIPTSSLKVWQKGQPVENVDINE